MSSTIPAEASETLVYSPANLEAKMDVPPRFRLRAVSHREKRHFDRLLNEEGLRQHSTEAIRAEMLRGLVEVGTPETAAELEPRVKAFWEALDDHDKEQAELPAEERTAFDHPDLERIQQLGNEIAYVWKPLRKMTADNVDYLAMLPLISVAVAVQGWEGLEALFEKDRGFLTVECADAVRKALSDLDEAHGIDAGLSWSQLYTKALSRIFLPKDQEKNSASPSPSSNPPSNTKTDGQVSPAGTSPASATLTETPAS